jgi:glucose/arabinose dehydrogenase
MKYLLSLLLTALVAFPAAAYETYRTVGDVPVQRGFERVTLFRGLEHPWGMTWLPEGDPTGDMLITERPGRLRVVREGALVPEPVSGVPEIFAENQGGLLDVSLHPDFGDNRLVYLTLAHGDQEANRTRVVRGRLDGMTLTDVEVVFEVGVAKVGGQHFGSRIIWLPDDTMLVSIGDGGNPPISLGGEFIRNKAQELDYHLGKILRLTPDGTPPEDNPFVDAEPALPEVWSYGHRNVQGLAWDPIRKQVWATEHGALGGDELNQPRAGINYGWPKATYSREYTDGTPIATQPSIDQAADPVVVWMTAIAPSGLAVYTGDHFPEWKGDLFAGGLISQDVRHIVFDEAGNVADQKALRIGARVRDVAQGPDGHLYVLTDEDSGRLIRIEPAAVTGDQAAPSAP